MMMPRSGGLAVQLVLCMQIAAPFATRLPFPNLRFYACQPSANSTDPVDVAQLPWCDPTRTIYERSALLAENLTQDELVKYSLQVRA